VLYLAGVPLDARPVLRQVFGVALRRHGHEHPSRKGRQAMQHKHLQFGHGFKVVLGDEHSQAAQMTLAPGETEGGPDNRIRGANQWLFVVSGTGEAVVNGEDVPINAGTLLLIARGDTHEIRNTGDGPLRTLNIYVPPAYPEDGEELPRGRK
jgi:mannose-6-phosphate isomerase-like protein (cupin superfamily)